MTFYVAGGFDGTVSIGGSDLTFPDDCTNVVVVDNGAGLEIWYEETPMPQIYTMSCIMVLLGGAVLMMKLVQKLKVSP